MIALENFLSRALVLNSDSLYGMRKNQPVLLFEAFMAFDRLGNCAKHPVGTVSGITDQQSHALTPFTHLGDLSTCSIF